jgi:diguanylate cyclase (GGDEF)-like protein/PAS domain S-box-containing protein
VEPGPTSAEPEGPVLPEGLPERLLELAPFTVMLVDGGGVIRWASGDFGRVSGFEPPEVIGTNVLEYIDTAWNPIALDSIGAALTRRGLQRAMLFRLRRKDGTTFVAEVQANSQWHDPELSAMAVYVRRWDEQVLLSEVVEHIASRSPVGETLAVLTRITGAETLDATGVVLADLDRGRCRSSFTAFELSEALRSDTGDRGSPWRMAIDTGTPQWVSVEDLAEPLRDEAERAGFRSCWAWPVRSSGEPAGCIVLWRRDDEEPDHTCTMLLDNLVRITGLVLEREQEEARLRHAASHDPLTQLPNRASFFASLQDALDQGSGPRVGVLYIDLDRFKPVNDSLGHGVGDEVLRAVGGRLLGAVRGRDVVARLGGDEFAVLCESVDGDSTLEAIAARVSESIARPIAVGDERITIGASVGIAHAAPGSCSIDVLMEAADAALYMVKTNGRGGWRVGSLG